MNIEFNSSNEKYILQNFIAKNEIELEYRNIELTEDFKF